MVMRLISLLLRNQKRVFAVEDVPAPPATTEQISDFVQNRVVVLVDNVAEVKVVNNGNHEFNKYKAIEASLKRAEYYVNVSFDALGIFQESKEKRILQSLTDFSLNRSF